LIHPGIRVASWNEHSFPAIAGFVPFDGDSVRGVFGIESERPGQPSGSDLGKANQANAGHAVISDQLDLKRRRNDPGQHIRPTAKVDKDSPVNDAAHHRHLKTRRDDAERMRLPWACDVHGISKKTRLALRTFAGRA
jgi:hypothetical protein